MFIRNAALMYQGLLKIIMVGLKYNNFANLQPTVFHPASCDPGKGFLYPP
jgi:hypothetical protein